MKLIINTVIKIYKRCLLVNDVYGYQPLGEICNKNIMAILTSIDIPFLPRDYALLLVLAFVANNRCVGFSGNLYR